MERPLSKLQYVSWGIVGLFLCAVAVLYQRTHQGIVELSFFYVVNFGTILCLNLFIGVWSVRNHASSSTISFIVLLVSLSTILIGFSSIFPSWVQRITILTVSFFPVFFLHFFIEHVSEKKYKDLRNRLFLYFQFFISLFREISSQWINASASNFFFFGGILILCIFCSMIFLDENKQQNTLWKPQEAKLLLISSGMSFLPFILGSLLPSLLIWGEFRNSWTLFFLLILPVILGYLFNKNNLIIHRYWKLSLLTSIGLYILAIALLWGVLRVTTAITTMELFLASHYFIAIGFIINILFIFYSNYRKKSVYNEMDSFEEEKSALTYFQLKNSLTEKIFQNTYFLLEKQFKVNGLAIFDNNEPLFLSGDSDSTFSIDEINEKLNHKSTLQLDNKKLLIFKMSTKAANAYIFILNRHIPFNDNEMKMIQKEIEPFISFLIDYEDLLRLKTRLEDRPYTALEKSVYFREMEIADLYHDMISRYLHDEVQQNILSLQHMSYHLSDVQTIQERIEEVVSQTEHSIREKTIQWEGLPKTNQPLGESLDKLYKTLRYQYAQVIKKEIRVDSTAFAKENSAVQSLLYRSIKECMINTFKHSKAECFTIQLTREADKWHLLVKDDGIGTDYTINKTNRFGLVSLYRQIHLFNGEMKIYSQKNNGFKVRITLPSFVHEEEERKQ